MSLLFSNLLRSPLLRRRRQLESPRRRLVAVTPESQLFGFQKPGQRSYTQIIPNPIPPASSTHPFRKVLGGEWEVGVEEGSEGREICGEGAGERDGCR